MHLVERFFATVTYLVSLLPGSGFYEADGTAQAPILEVQRPGYDVHPPIFKPPTGGRLGQPGGDLVCDYTAMGPDWGPCSSPDNRGCWLRNSKTGEEFNITTDYEDKVPIGVHRHYELQLEDGWVFADGLNFTEAKLFSNTSDPQSWQPDRRYPGPWVQACWGDTVHVNVVNNMRFNGTSVHWHGIRQLETPESDGVPGVTQCPVAPGYSYTYDWTARQYGSSWYHSHFSLQYADGALGPLTIHGPTSADWDEPKYPILMTDWSHNSAFEAIWTDLVNQSTLLNGVGNVTRFNNSINKTTAGVHDVPEPYSITISSTRVNGRAKAYLLRLINTSYESFFMFSIDNHMLQVISTDFVPIVPYNTTFVSIGIGQRYNVIVHATPINSKAKSFWMRTWRPKCFRANTAGSDGYEKAGILFYDNETKHPDWHGDPWPIDQTYCMDEPYDQLEPVVPWTVGKPNPSPNRDPFANVKEELAVQLGNQPGLFPLALFSIGGESFNPFQIDYGNPIFLHLDFSGKWDSRWVVYPEDYTLDSWVYLLLKGVPTGSTTGAHPIHLHGHDFAILQQIQNETFPNGLNPKWDNPPRRDVVLLPQNGYAIIAFRTDNPGPWIMHCHIAQHASFGLAMQVLERQSAAYHKANVTKAIVKAQQNCNNWNKWWGDCRNWWYDTHDKKQRPGHYCNEGANAFSPDSGI